MLDGLRVFAQLVAVGMRSQLQYRAAFLIASFGQLLNGAMALAMVATEVPDLVLRAHARVPGRDQGGVVLRQAREGPPVEPEDPRIAEMGVAREEHRHGTIGRLPVRRPMPAAPARRR